MIGSLPPLEPGPCMHEPWLAVRSDVDLLIEIRRLSCITGAIGTVRSVAADCRIASLILSDALLKFL